MIYKGDSSSFQYKTSFDRSTSMKEIDGVIEFSYFATDN
jgi:hypothetical protein